MLMKTLAEFASVEEAAKEMAGNYKTWRNFVWFGEDDVPDNQNVMLGYVRNNLQGGLEDETHYEMAKRLLKRHMGDLRNGGLVDDFGSSFHGDKNAFSGFQVRVYDADGMITRPFQRLYRLAIMIRDDHHAVEEVREQTNRRLLMEYVGRELSYELEVKKTKIGGREVKFTGELVARVVNILVDEEEVSYDEIEDEKIMEVLTEIA